MKVLITGSSGRVGRAIYPRLEEKYDVSGLDIVKHSRHDTYIGDITKIDEVKPAFEGQDAVIHLAGKPSPLYPWDEILKHNIIGTYNVFEASHEVGVNKIIFASSLRVVHMYDEEYKPEIYEPSSNISIDHTDPVRPDSYYAVSKLFGEQLGRMYTESRSPPSQFYVLRSGGVTEDNHPFSPVDKRVEKGEIEKGSEHYINQINRRKGLWLSHKDYTQIVDKMLQDKSVNYGIFFGVSDNDRRWVDIENAREVLGYEPINNSSEW